MTNRVTRSVLTPWARLQGRRRFRASLRPLDTFIVGHPRSGNTWLAYMLAILLEKGDPDCRVTVANIGHFIPVIHGRDPLIINHAARPDPRIFRNERPNYPNLYPRTLFIVRDPRATLVSYFHYYRTLARDEEMTLDAFVARYLADGCIVDFEPDVVRWDRMVTEWVGRGGRRPVMIVRYEEIHEDRNGLLGRISSFCGLDPPAHALESAVKRGSFESMRQEEGRHGVEPQHPPDPPSRGWFFRQGRTDGWSSELSAESLAAVDRAFGSAMEAVGYSPAS